MRMHSGLWSCGLLALATFGATCARADTIFYDDLSNGSLSNWTLTGTAALKSSGGNYSISVPTGSTATHNVTTVGYTRVTVSAMLSASSLESADSCVAEVSTNSGASWSTLLVLTDGQDDGAWHVAATAPSGLDNNANVRLRFRSVTGTGDYCYGDNFQVEGKPAIDTEGFAPLPGSGSVVRTGLTYATLTGASAAARIDLSAFALPVNAAQPTNTLEGRVTLVGNATGGSFVEIVDSFNYTGLADDPRKHLPDFSFDFVQSGSHVIPTQRGAIASSHASWEYVLTPGRVWNEAGDNGYSRVALPFTLLQKNANCTHNGVLTFLFKDNGQVSRVAYQISSETCEYFKVDMWGLLSATYVPATNSNYTALVGAYQTEVAQRLPTKNFNELAIDNPTLDVGKMIAPGTTDPNSITLNGFYANGTLYTGNCRTRWGLYPYCANLVVPSYSAAKSAFAGVAMMRLEKKYPGARSEMIAPYVPQCGFATWGDVKLENSLDMATGNYARTTYMSDEDASGTNGLFLTLTHPEKIDYSCNTYSRKSTPGTQWVYHTSDIYIAGTMMNAFVKQHEGAGADLFSTTVAGELWQPLGLSQTALYTRRTYDSYAQPFTGWGLIWLRDDVGKIGRFLGIDNGAIAGTPMLDSTLLNAALQRNSADRGLIPLANYRYNNGFWALNIAANVACSHDLYVPFMSGYGGITVLLLPNNTIYYYFSDNGTYLWLDAAIEANKFGALCTP